MRDEALRLREEQRRDRNEQLQKLAKVNPREAGRMIVARIRQMRDGGLPADKDDLDDLRALGQSKARAKGRLRAKQTRSLFKRAKALRDDAYEAEQAAKHALQALMDDKERKRVDEELRLLELGLSVRRSRRCARRNRCGGASSGRGRSSWIDRCQMNRSVRRNGGYGTRSGPRAWRPCLPSRRSSRTILVRTRITSS